MKRPDYCLLAVAFCLPLYAASCGYTFGFKAPRGIKTMQIPIFANKTLIRGIEFEITELLAEELKIRSQISIVQSGANALLTGEITGYKKTPIAETRKDLISGRITISVSVTLKCLGETVLDNQEFTGSEEFDRRTGSTEEQALHGAVREIAEKILFEMQEY